MTSTPAVPVAVGDSRAPTAVIFDLDGTLVQTRIASWEVFRGVSDDFELGVRTPEEFFALFDGNVFASIRRLCRDDAHAAAAKRAFLDRLGTDYHPLLVPGIGDVVRRLASSLTLAVMSSNATPLIRRVLSEHDLALCFSHVFGGDVNESKRAGIEAFLADPSVGPGRRCQGAYDETSAPVRHDPSRTVLITDTVGDVEEARAAGIRAVGVVWGMHDRAELTRAGAEFVAVWPQELLTQLLGAESGRPAIGACALPGGDSGGPAAMSAEPASAVATAAAVRRARAQRRGVTVEAAESSVGPVAQPPVGSVRSSFSGEATLRELRQASAVMCCQPRHA